MIYNTEVEINGVKYKYTYSDKYKIKKVGTEEVYDSAYDVIDSDFEYTETTEELEEITEDTIDN